MKIKSRKKEYSFCLGRFIFYLRTKKFELTQSEVANEMEIAQSTLSRCETGKATVWTHIYDFGTYYNFTPVDLLRPINDFTDKEKGDWIYPVDSVLVQSAFYSFLISNSGKYL